MTERRKIFLDSFTTLDDLPRRKRRDPLVVLAALARAKRFSTFEVDGSIAHSLSIIERNKWIEFVGGQYPWHKVRITPAGRAALKERNEV